MAESNKIIIKGPYSISHNSNGETVITIGNEVNRTKGYGRPLSNEVGVKGRYSILENDKGEIMIMLDAREGGPENPRFIYDGSDTALLYRSPESSVAFRKIEERAREPLKRVSEILIVEIENDDVEREYVVPVRLVRDVNNLIVS